MGTKERWKGFRELPSDIIQGLERLVPLFERENVLLAYLFGSLSRGQEGNDVDLAILVQDRPAFRLRDAILDCLGTERVDLVDLRRAPPVLRFEIIRTGHPLYVSDQALQARFELATLHLYRDTHYLRRRQEQYMRERFAQWSSNEPSFKKD
jgi:predicted nucleotidyltransferase